MIQDTTRLLNNSDVRKLRLKNDINKQEKFELLFDNNDKLTNLEYENDYILETEEKISELEKQLEKLKNNKKERKKFRIFSGTVVTSFLGSAMLGSKKDVLLEDLDEISLKLEKIARKIKSPVKCNLFCIGTFLAKLLVIGITITSLFIILGNEQDKDKYKNTEQQLEEEKKKLAEQKAQLANLELIKEHVI